MPLLEIRGLAVHYGTLEALRGVELEVSAGEVVALAGENGAGKSTLVRCIVGDASPSRGEVLIDGQRVRAGRRALGRRDVAVVWQDLALCENLDVAANLFLGREDRRGMRSYARFHLAAEALLAELDIPITDTTRRVDGLSGGQRQLLAVARAMRDRPRLLVLDEPTAALGVLEAAQVEELTRRLAERGTTILLVSHDIDQMFRLADRIAILRHGRVVADVPTDRGHPDDVVAVLSGQQLDSTPRRQLDRLHGLVDRLSSSDPSSSLSLILTALSAAIGAHRVCLHLLERDHLRLAGAVGLAPEETERLRDVALDDDCSPVADAARTGSAALDHLSPYTRAHHHPAPPNGASSHRRGPDASWSVPIVGAAGVLGVITVLRTGLRAVQREELDLVGLYARYAGEAIERDRLLGEVTARNRVLETIREVLERLAGPAPLSRGLDVAVATLRAGLDADEAGLLTAPQGEELRWRAWADRVGSRPPEDPALRCTLVEVADPAADQGEVVERWIGGRRLLVVTLAGPDGPLVLFAGWSGTGPVVDAVALIGDAARSLRLALEREATERAHREAAALRRSQDLQREFLSRLSHELRTPLTAIRGYASSLLAPDVTWDRESEARFLDRIAAESARLGRLVDDLLDISAIEANIMRLQRDWCDLPLVLEAARACLAPSVDIRVHTDTDLPAVWADHDRIEQVLVNLLDNAVRHNPPGTAVSIGARCDDTARVTIHVRDDGRGVPSEMLAAPFDRNRRRSPTAGAGLGLSIAEAIVTAHGGLIRLDRVPAGTCWHIELPATADADEEVAAALGGES